MGKTGPKSSAAARRGPGAVSPEVPLLSLRLVDGLKPDPLPGWDEGQVADWDGFWRSPAGLLVDESDLPALRRLWALRNTADLLLVAASAEPLVQGARGARVANPLFGKYEKLLPEIRQIEDRFCMSPAGRRSVTVERAAVNARTLDTISNDAITAQDQNEKGTDDE